MDYPGIGNQTFKLRLTQLFDKGDILNDHLIILSTEKLEYGYCHKVTTEEDYKHKQFLVKYSNYLRF